MRVDRWFRIRSAAAVLLAMSTLAACGSTIPEGSAFVDVPESNDGTVMVPLPDGGLLYGRRSSGEIRRVDRSGSGAEPVVATLALSTGGDRGLLGITRHDNGTVFASWTDPDGNIAVGQIEPAPTRLVWKGPKATDTHVGGALAFTPTGRLALSLGDLQDPAGSADADHPGGKILTLDPERGPDQRPNAISRGWTDPVGIVYMNDLLWITDRGADGTERVGRAGPEGFSGKSRSLGVDVGAVGFTVYGDREMLVCLGKSRSLKRLLVNDVEAVPGRSLASDCSGAVIQLADARVAYQSPGAIKVTG